MLVSAGESLIDYIQRPASGRNPVYEACPGGSPYNVALAMGTLGATSGFLCPISGDSLGRLLADRLDRANSTLLLPEPSGRATSLAVVSISAPGENTYQFYRKETAESDVTLERLEQALPTDLTALHTGSLVLATRADSEIWGQLAHRAADRGSALSIDPNIRSRFVEDWGWLRESLGALFGKAAIVKTSDEDLHHLGIEADPARLRALFVERHGVGLFAMTRGGEGAILMSREATVEVAPYRPPRFVDTVGAGDTFMAGLLVSASGDGPLTRQRLGRLDAAGLDAIGRFAAVAAGLNCGEQGCNPPPRSVVVDVLRGLG